MSCNKDPMGRGDQALYGFSFHRLETIKPKIVSVVVLAVYN